jgi:hypothetical protein
MPWQAMILSVRPGQHWYAMLAQAGQILSWLGQAPPYAQRGISLLCPAPTGHNYDTASRLSRAGPLFALGILFVMAIRLDWDRCFSSNPPGLGHWLVSRAESGMEDGVTVRRADP